MIWTSLQPKNTWRMIRSGKQVYLVPGIFCVYSGLPVNDFHEQARVIEDFRQARRYL